MNKCLAAHTPPGSNYPPYINASETESGMVRVIIREADSQGMISAHIDLPIDDWLDFLRQANASAAIAHRAELANEEKETA